MKSVLARVPTRLDLSGGTLDIWPLHLALPEPAVTVNVALDVGAEVRVRAKPPGEIGVSLVSRDQGTEVHYETPLDLDAALADGTCPLPLLGRSAAAVGPGGGFTLETNAKSPQGAGLGGSSALLVALVGALHAAVDEPVEPGALLRLAQDVETALLGMPTGYQDYHPPLFGGLLALEGAPGGVVVERLEMPLAELGARLRVVYTGAPHVSGITNWNVVRAYLDGEETTRRALHELARIARTQRTALREGDLDAALGALVEDGAVRRRMAPAVDTPEIGRLDAGVRAAGALGTKICGAGGGGCVMVALPKADDGAVDRWLTANAAEGGSRVLDARLAEGGLEIEDLEGEDPGGADAAS